MTIQELFEKTIQANASDLHLIANSPPNIRVDGKLVQLASYPPLTAKDVEDLVLSTLTPEQKELFLTNRSLDYSYGYGEENTPTSGRFRINLYFQKGTTAGAYRLLPAKVKTIEELKLPQVCHDFAKLKQGFVLVTGPTGHGKSTTLASMVNEINMTQADNIVTIEDPIEYIYPKGRSIISQREIGIDSLSWGESLRSALREDPDVVLVGEMRDPESISSAITMAETGHLIFSTLHTNSAAQTVDRIIDSFPDHQQNQIRAQLASSLEGIISQRLVPKIDGGRIVVCEVMIANNAIKSNIREAKTHLIDSIIETSQESGMISLEASLASLVKQGLITLETARAYVLRQDSFAQLMG
ncbi:MAG TPA: type IV pilus twitching motility protein PilT [Patescibacteria group bacterium]|nr:type IV pilus twitching motility protein PilT [Patescibacteria group bacterium]